MIGFAVYILCVRWFERTKHTNAKPYHTGIECWSDVRQLWN